MRVTVRSSESRAGQEQALLDVLRSRARREPDRRLYAFLQDGEVEAGPLTCGELDRRARVIAAALRRERAPGDRALLLFPPGLDFIAAFFGCLYAGVVAVPAYPPRPQREDPRLLAMARDCGPGAVLTTSALLETARQAADRDLAAVEWIATDLLPEREWDGPDPRPDDLAFLQYTSGSTSSPKGVMVRHRNLAHNSRMIREAFGQDESSLVVGWLPLYHDMGLIGTVLQPLFCGGECVLMSPMAFLQRPRRWLEAITRYRGTTSGAPDFAYDLCVRKIGPAEREGLDLSSWTVAFNGAEPVRADTLERFAAAFAGCGFRREAFYPCYGLAEATLFVTGGTRGAGHRAAGFDAAALARHEAALPGDAPARWLVSCGGPWLEQRVVIADPETGELCPPGRIGEIWVSGGSVAAGYWDRPEETARDFAARPAGLPESPPFLRTGDLGFVESRELFVTGRLKDLIILRGRNHYPQDLERSAESAHPALRPGGSAAFAVEDGERERLVLVCEVERRAGLALEAEEVAAAVRQAIAEESEVQVEEVVLIRTGTLPRTSSGKVRRRACREAWAGGRLAVVASSALPRGDGALEAGGDASPRERLEADLLCRVAGVLGTSPSHLRRDLPLTRAGLDSLAAIELQHGLEADFGVAPSLSALLSGASVADVAAELDGASGREPDGAPRPLGDQGAEHPLSPGQRALWFLEQLQPDTTAFVLGGAAEALGPLDVPALRRALNRLADRHPALRTAFGLSGGEPVQRILDRAEVEFSAEDAAGWSGEDLRRRLGQAIYAPFDLAAGRTLRVGVFHRGPAPAVLWLAMHHLVSDLWSVSILWRDLAALYGEETGGPPAALPPVPLSYPDCVRWQEQRLAGEAGERLWAYWSRRLAGPLPVLDLPTDRPRPPVRTHRGAAETVRLSPEQTGNVKALGRVHGATFYATLLAGFQALLHRYTGQDDLLVGSSTTGRNAAGTGEVVGYFINPVVLRADLSGAPPFAGFLARTRDAVLEAFAHQDYPFPRLAERLHPDRDPSRSPVFQVYFVMERVQDERARGLSAFALNEPGGRLNLAGTPLASLRLPDRSAQFDLMLLLAEPEEGLSLALEYNEDLFDAATARRILGHFRTLLAAAAADPGRRVGTLPLLAGDEREQILAGWSAPPLAVSGDACLHELFAAQARRTPRAVAAVHDIDELTYEALDRRADRLARRLCALGVGPDVLVGLSVERSLALPVGLLGILKAGGTYLPLDPSYPAERLAFMLEDARVPVLVTQRSLADRLPAGAARVVVLDDPAAADEGGLPSDDVGAVPENLAYAIYTSGSTGRPKGTLITHANVVRLFRAVEPWFGFGPQDVWTCFHSYAFDFSVWEIWGALLYGGRVVIVPYRVSRSPEAFHDLLATEGVTVLSQTPSAFGQLVAAEETEGPAGPALRLVVFGGEALQLRSLAPWFDRHGDRSPELVNMYGITETTVHVTYRPLRAEDARGGAESPVGRPIPDLRVLLLDRNLELVPAGVPGEIHVGGAGLARGYLDRPGLTAERFVPDPYAAEPGARLYKSGDLARWLPGGELDYLGRADHQVKVRGFRIELGEIEATLAGHPAVAQAVVVARGPRLVAYVVPRDRAAARGPELRDFARDRLPDYMVPAAVVLLDALPLTPTGKADRRALPDPEKAGSEAAEAGAAPRTSTEAALAEIWAELLAVEEVGVEESFFALGGHSLLATQMISRIRETLKAELDVVRVFETPTVAELAAAIDAKRRGGELPAAPPVRSVPRGGPLPLSFAQARLWFLHQLEPAMPVYNAPLILRFSRGLPEDALEWALGEILRRHEALRTGFVSLGGEPAQVIETGVGLPLPRIDLASLPDDRREAELRRLAGEEARRPFDLSRPPLCRGLLLRVSPGESALVLVLHHIVSDGWSIGVFLRELAALSGAFSRGERSPLSPLPVQSADYAVWQREWLRGEVLERHLAWWRRLEGAPLLELPTDRPRPAVPTWRGGSLSRPLPAELIGSLEAFSRRRGATLFMTLGAGFAALLSRYSGEEDLTVGTPVANRNRAEIEGLIGFFVNTLPLRFDLSGAPGFGTLLRRTRREVLGASEHQDLPFERIVAELKLERSLDQSPLFQTVFALQNTPLYAPGPDGLDLDLEPLHTGTAKYDLTVSVERAGERLVARLEHSTDLFDEAWVERLWAHFQILLAGAVTDPERPLAALPLLTGAEVEQLLAAAGAPLELPAEATLHGLVETQAARTPEATAVVFEDEELSYRELDRRASVLARRLAGMGVGPGARVGVCLERSPEMVVALLAVLKAGGAYVPLDPSYPEERLAFLVEDSASSLLLVEERTLDRLPPGAARVLRVERGEVQGEAAPGRPVAPESPAYVLYTSGSTGRPKGVQVVHRGLVNFLASMARQPGFSTEDVLVAVTTLSFDIAGLELFLPLSLGARVVLASRETAADGSALLALLASRGATVLQATPATWRLLLEAGWDGEPRLRALCGGEALPPDLAAALLARCPEVWNLYGPTETTIWSAVHRVTPEPGPVPIGGPIHNTRIHILDRSLQPLPDGVPGELGIGGLGLAQGYFRRPGLTAERFVPDPCGGTPGARIYRTGDLARRRPDGKLEFLGRRDHQVKIRGFRIELGEIEAALSALPGVRQAAAVARQEAGRDARIVAFVVPEDGAAPADPRSWAGVLRSALQGTLPGHMLPAGFVPLAALPLTPNGKLDRKALAMAAAAAPEASGGSAAPRDGVEAVLAEIWAEVLGLPRVGLHDSFFDLGGHSLLAIRVISRIRGSLHTEIPLRLLFTRQTVAELATAVREARGAGRPVPPIQPVPREGEMPLSFAQQRLWILDRMDPGSAAYHMPSRLRLKGDLDLAALGQTVAAIVDRHEALRTTFPETDGRPRQVVAAAAPRALPLVDLAALPPALREKEAVRLATESARFPFDLAAGPLLRVAVLRRSPGEHDILWTMHHIVADGWSLDVLAREVAALYTAFLEGRPSPLPGLPVQYADFAVWQRSLLEQGFYEEDLAYWRERLQGLPPALDLPTDRPFPAEPSFRGSWRELLLPEPLTATLRGLGRRRSATLFVTLAAAFQALLARSSGQEELGLGFPVSGRDRIETEGLIGFFVNTLVLRADLRGNPPFERCLERQRDLLLEAHDHQGLPFERLVDELAPQRSLERTPLFQVFFAIQEATAALARIPGLSLDVIDVDSGAVPFDLSLLIEDHGRSLRAILHYRADLFDAPSVDRLLRSLAALLEGAAADPSRPVQALPLLGEAERHQLLIEWNGPRTGAPAEGTLHGLVEAQAARTPEATAAVFAGRTLSYRELDRRANRLARHLRALGVGPEVPVAICCERSLELAVGLLGILKAGGYYLPLDPEYPAERLAFMLRDSGAAVLLTLERIAPSLPSCGAAVVSLDASAEEIGRHEDRPLTGGALPANAAYVIYTSGSTGVPKGVVVEHAAVVQYSLEAARGFGLEADDRILQFASPSFDVLIEELFPTWARGAAVVFAEPDRIGSCAALEETLASERATAVELPAAFWHEWVHALQSSGGAPPSSLRFVLLGCEKPSPDRLAAWERFGIPLIYVFGLTETTITNTLCRLSSGGRPGQETPIGRPVADTEVYLLDSGGEPVPAGVAGELFIGGAGLARGYWNRPDLTAERFVPHPFAAEPGARLYRTGDLGRHLPDGRIDFLGRIDHQVKIRGFRVETGEVETALRRHPAVAEAVVVARGGRPGERRLTAYVTPAGGYRVPGGGLSRRDSLLRREKLEIWPSHGEYPVYDELLYSAMTHDQVRNELYRRAIARHVEGKVVVDVGTGADATLSRFCIEAGARRVYAVEGMESSYRKARACVERLSLEDRIHVLHGEATEVELPEKADICVSELIGSIGGSEGAAAILDSVRRRLLREGGAMVPERCVTRIAAARLPDEVLERPAFGRSASHYTRRIFEAVGSRFDLRLCLRGFPLSHVVSEEGVFEDLDFRGGPAPDRVVPLSLRIRETSRVDGFLLWIELYPGEGEALDSLRHECSFLPVYLPVFSPGLELREGDRIEAECGSRLCEDGIHPDYWIVGSVQRPDGPAAPFSHTSYHHSGAAGGTELHRRLLASLDAGVVEDEAAEVTVRDLREHLAEHLPEHMIPAHFVPLRRLPLMANGKVDQRALPPPDLVRSDPEEGFAAPRTETESLLARIWGEVLGVGRVGVHDNFFELGGDSILSLQILARAHREGLVLSPRQIFQLPTVAQLAAAAGRSAGTAGEEQGPVTGAVTLTPIQRWFFARDLPEPHHWNMPLLLAARRRLDPARLARSVESLLVHHDALRLRFERGPEGWKQWIDPPGGPAPFTHADLSALPSGRRGAALEAAAAEVQRGFDLARGPLLRAVLFAPGAGEPERLLLTVHHLAVDGVSWRVFLDDLRQLYETALPLPPRGTSFQDWARRLEEHAQSPELRTELPVWLSGSERSGSLPAELAGGDDSTGAAEAVTTVLSAEETRVLVQEVPPVYRATFEEVLLTAFTRAWSRWAGERSVRVDLEGHGREDLFSGVDLSRTVGFFTTLAPVHLESDPAWGPGETLRSVKEQLRQILRRGLGYGLLRYLSADPDVRGRLSAVPDPDVRFEYLGQLDAALAGSSLFVPARESAGPAESPRGRRSHRLEITARVLGGELRVDWTHGSAPGRRAAIEALGGAFLSELRELMLHCLSPEAGGFTASDFPLARLSTTALDTLLAGDRNVEDLYPLSGMQEGMLFHTLYDPRQGAYVAQYVYTLEGDLDEAAFEHAWQRVIDRHTALRSCFFWEGIERPLQLVRRHAPLGWRRRDWRGLDPARRETLLARYLRADRRLGFDLRRAPLVRLARFRTADRAHRLVLSFHQMILDGWSLPLVFREVLAAYAASLSGGTAGLPAARPYRDYIAWLAERDLEEAEAFWRSSLAGFNRPTPVGPRVPVRPDARTGPSRLELRLSEAATARLTAQAHRLRITPNTLLQGAWAVLLAAYAGEEEVVFGATVSGRPAELPGVETLVGMFLNTLPVRVRIADDVPLASWLSGLQDRQIEARRHEHAPLSRIQGWSDMPAGQALFEAILVFESYPVDSALREGGWGFGIRVERTLEQPHNPLTLVAEPGRGLLLGVIFDRRRFDEASIHRLLGHLGTLLDGIVADAGRPPAALPLLGDAERHQLLRDWNDTASEYPRERTLHSLFTEQAERTPGAPAVEAGSRLLTYRELDELTNRLARRLRRCGVGPESAVGLCVERAADLVVGILGILKAGGAYVPLDPGYPRERLGWMLEDAGVAALVTCKPLLERLPAPLPPDLGLLCLDRDAASLAQESSGRLSGEGPAEGLAYVMYTSGSTGRPKGVAVTHRNVVRLVLGTNYVDLGPSDRMGQVSNTSFDAATFEVWGALLTGGCLVGISRDVLFAPRDFAAALIEQRITATFLTAALFHQTVDEVPDAFRCFRHLLAGGDALDPVRVARALAAGPPERLLNGYGPTEGTTFSTWYRIEEVAPGAATVPIGWPLANGTGHALDRHGRLLPAGAFGELYVGGDGLARGYLNRPDLTAERFVPSPFGAGERLYRTGDLVVQHPDGAFDCLGRLDQQVKIRGFRIEPGEVESVLARDPRVSGAAVTVRDDLPGGRALVAYFVARPEAFSEGASREGELRASLRSRLPAYMVPAFFVELAELPLNQNGKVDRRALPRPEAAADPAGREDALAPSASGTRELLSGIWSEVLGRERIGPQDSFFDLGGHSLLATQLVSRVREVFQVELPVRALFDEPTVAGLASLIEQHLRDREKSLPPPRIERTSEEGEPELSFAQQRLWFVEQLEPDKALFNMPLFLRLTGPLDVSALGRALAEIRRRHEILRARFPAVQGRPQLHVAPPEVEALPVCDLGGLDGEARGAEVRLLAAAEALRPFDLARGGLLRAALLRLGPAEHVLLLAMHHIVSDGWSLGVLVREAGALYEAFRQGRPSPLAELPVQYTDFARWQRDWLQGEVGEAQLAYWKRQLAGIPASLALPLDRARPQWPTRRGAVLSLPIGPELAASLRELSRREGATLFMSLLAGFGVLLYQETGQDDLLVGSAIANRNRAETEGLIGFFVNMLPLRIDLSGGPRFRQLLQQVRRTTLGAYAHQDLPFDRLVDELRPGRESGGNPLLQVAFGVQNAPLGPVGLPGLTLEPLEIESTEARFDLTVWITETRDSLAVSWSYDTDLFEGATIERLHARFAGLLAGIAANPDARIDALKRSGDGPSRQEEKAERFLSTRRKAVTLAAAEHSEQPES